MGCWFESSRGRVYCELKKFLEAIQKNEIPASTMLILDNDIVFAFTEGQQVFQSDPHTLLRQALDLLGVDYDET